MTLADWLRQNGKTATWLASQVGRDPSFITRVKNGDAMPSIEVAAAIQRVTGGAVTAIDYIPPVEGAHQSASAA
ncbi:helix-turn-helix transcriptional regulator [Methylorubrum extorquens]|uniref:helix-turn-helix domain-containing protein n=1 Tax=Methylorubrum extorquens TaxID=408 RepID=UPI0022385FD3|nr:helix-turn-helix transcriptional regulator [Methylorubrum extorquens]UYW25716.1 helix-turn-helix transcriptional regulator [Methylorubrum extorquens]